MKYLIALFFVLTSSFLYAGNSFNDTDGDGVEDSVDNCPNTYNVLQLDTNGDGIGDACQVSYIDERCVYEYTFTTQYEITRLFLNGEDVNELLEPIQGFQLAFRSGDDPYVHFLGVLASILNTEINEGVWFKNDFNDLHPSEENPVTLVFSKEYVETIDIDFDFEIPIDTYTNCKETLSSDSFELNKNDVSIYPNPSTDIINIASSIDPKKITIYNILGQEVLNTNLKTININNLKSGVYIMAVDFENSRITKRIMKN